jgi:O-antigen/teichoic acid export membrane protein
LLLFAGYALSLLGTILLNQLYSAAYQTGRPIIPLVSASIVFLGIYHVFTTGAHLQRKTWFMTICSTLAALVNFGANLLLIPRFQAMGAALSTLLALIVMTSFAYIVNLRLYPVHYEIGTFTIGLLIGTGFYLGADFIALHQDLYTAWGIRFAALCLYGVCLFLLAKRLEARAKIQTPPAENPDDVSPVKVDIK